MLGAALLVIPVIVVEQSGLSERWKRAAEIANWAIWLVFAVEVNVMLVLVEDRLRWVRAHPIDLLIVVLTPPVLPATLQAARLLRVLRIALLAALPVLFRRRFNEADVLRYVSLLVVVTALGGGAAFSAVERGRSTWDGV